MADEKPHQAAAERVEAECESQGWSYAETQAHRIEALRSTIEREVAAELAAEREAVAQRAESLASAWGEHNNTCRQKSLTLRAFAEDVRSRTSPSPLEEIVAERTKEVADEAFEDFKEKTERGIQLEDSKRERDEARAELKLRIDYADQCRALTDQLANTKATLAGAETQIAELLAKAQS